MQGRRLLAKVALVLMGASLIFSPSAFAHNINLVTAKAKVSRYAQRVVNARTNRYILVTTDCDKAFNGHNHYARCTVKYKDKETKDRDGEYACAENTEVFFQSHNLLRGENNTYYMRHTSRECGDMRLSN